MSWKVNKPYKIQRDLDLIRFTDLTFIPINPLNRFRSKAFPAILLRNPSCKLNIILIGEFPRMLSRKLTNPLTDRQIFLLKLFIFYVLQNVMTNELKQILKIFLPIDTILPSPCVVTETSTMGCGSNRKPQTEGYNYIRINSSCYAMKINTRNKYSRKKEKSFWKPKHFDIYYRQLTNVAVDTVFYTCFLTVTDNINSFLRHASYLKSSTVIFINIKSCVWEVTCFKWLCPNGRLSQLRSNYITVRIAFLFVSAIVITNIG